ncbi:BCL-2-associated athanogene 1 [Perilla frutescens var. hirtella]|nr:BCL-2-associated athanogene 1 [Perilla frutescens var. frutescens]KAH6792452.1 BCL-2-associated athanogene 1 [Perilla frutescens var. hirtella]
MNKDDHYMMLRMKPKTAGVSTAAKGGGGWEVRPGGMLVQKRNSDCDKSFTHDSNIKVRVKYGSSYHEITLSSHANFGELKNSLSGPTGLQPKHQKLMFKEKERDSKLFLDAAGVKDGSKIILIEDEDGDELCRERRRFESYDDGKLEKALKDIAAVRFEVDNLAKLVTSIEMEINGGHKIVDRDLSNLIELLMTQLIKLDGIAADGDVKMQRRVQVKRVQKYIEILDLLKIRNSGLEKM